MMGRGPGRVATFAGFPAGVWDARFGFVQLAGRVLLGGGSLERGGDGMVASVARANYYKNDRVIELLPAEPGERSSGLPQHPR